MPHVDPALSTQEIELVARADERLAHAYQQIARADEELARFNEQVFKLERRAGRGRETASPAIARQAGATRLDRPAVDSGHLYRCFRLAVPWRDGQADDLPVGTATGCGSSLPSETPKLADQQSPPAVQVAAADAAVSQLPPPAQTAPQEAAAAPIAAEQTQLLQTMARDLASVQQEIEQLKASQAGIGPRKCRDRRAAQGEPGANGARDRQRLRAEPAAEDSSDSATADAQARVGASDGSQSASAGAGAVAAQAVVFRRRRYSLPCRERRSGDKPAAGNRAEHIRSAQAVWRCDSNVHPLRDSGRCFRFL